MHGHLHNRQLRPNSYEWDRVYSSHMSSRPFYGELSDAGVKSAIIDMPVDHPLPGFHGIQVVDWGTEFKLWHFETRTSHHNIAHKRVVRKHRRHMKPPDETFNASFSIPSLPHRLQASVIRNR